MDVENTVRVFKHKMRILKPEESSLSEQVHVQCAYRASVCREDPKKTEDSKTCIEISLSVLFSSCEYKILLFLLLFNNACLSFKDGRRKHGWNCKLFYYQSAFLFLTF